MDLNYSPEKGLPIGSPSGPLLYQPSLPSTDSATKSAARLNRGCSVRVF